MIDKFGRHITYLRVSLIDRCNLRCFYCMPQGLLNGFKEEEFLTFDEIVRAVSLFAGLGIRKVRLTGGEPLLRKGVPSLVARVKNIPGIAEVVMTSNGALLGKFASELKAAGLDRINVSLDTLDRENFKRITGEDRFAEVLAGIEAAVSAGLRPVKLNAVLMKGVNDHEVLALVRFAAERGMEMRFIEWMPTAAQIRPSQESLFMDSEEARRLVEKEFTLVQDFSDPSAPARSYFLKGTEARVGFISPLSNAFCSSCNRLRLKANGKMKTCLHGQEDMDLRALLRGGLSDKEIREKIAGVVFERPKEHFLNDPSVRHNDFVMTAVGG